MKYQFNCVNAAVLCSYLSYWLYPTHQAPSFEHLYTILPANLDPERAPKTLLSLFAVEIADWAVMEMRYALFAT